MLVDTSAIVLKTIPFSESSLIVILLSVEHGKTSVMARGARRNKNRFGGLLQPGSLIDVTYYYKPTREVQNLSNVTQKYPVWRIHQEMEKMAIGLATLEISEQLCHEHEPMPEVFEFLSHFLIWLHKTEKKTKNLFPYIQFRLAQLIGIGLTWNVSESTVDSEFFLNVENGQISEKADNGLSFPLTKLQLQYLRCIVTGNKSKLLTDMFPGQEVKHLIYHMDAYFQYHIEGLKDRKSDAIFEQIL